MAYTEKYFISFCNPLGQACRVSIQENDFIGDSIELVGQQEPFVVAYDNSDDFKFKAIIESEASINLVFDDSVLSMSELWTSNERTFLVKYTIDSILEWTGFVIPAGFDYNLKGGKYDAVLTAIDGLSTLDGILFKTDNNQFYGFQDFGYNNGEQFPFILVLTEILRKLDLGIDIFTLVDYYEQTMTLLNSDTRDSDPLSISYVNVKTYINDTNRTDIPYFQDVNEAWDCKKIIENICNIWGARLYQESGVWRFKSIHADSVIANPYTTHSDSFIGTNPNQISDFLWEYEAYYSSNRDINLDTTVLFYNFFNEVVLNDKAYSDTALTITSVAGFYLIKGLNKLIEVNSTGSIISITPYQSAVTNYYWKKYNNTAGYLGRELSKTEVVIPCSNKDVFLKNNDALIRMDNVYKQFRVNFDYTFVRVGDSPINLLQNGNFALPFEQYGEFESPPNWERWRLNDNKWFSRGQVIDLIPEHITLTGSANALEFSVQYGGGNTPNTDTNPAIWASFVQKNINIDKKVTALNFSGWVQYRYKSGGAEGYFYPVFRSILIPANLVISNGFMEVYILQNVVNDNFELGWEKVSIPVPDSNYWFTEAQTFETLRRYFITNPYMGSRWVESDQDIAKWYNFNLKIQSPPVFGTIEFHIHGICGLHGKKTNSFPPFKAKIQEGTEMKDYNYPTVSNQDDVPRPIFTGLEIAYIPDPQTEVPKTDYIYANGDVDYTFQEDPIRVYNGDTIDTEIVSGIIVPTNTSGSKNKWDTFNNAFGKSDIGMILCKSIMQQYYKPNRLLDCEFKSDSYKYGDIIAFEHIPYVKFIMLRGSYNEKRCYWEDCTLAQISSDYIPQGGVVNGDTLDPQWQATGNTRCVKGDDGLNTGISEYETQDINSNSNSFGDFRWKSGGTNLDACPIGLSSRFYWGTDIDDYDVNNFKDYTITYEDDTIGEVQVSYNNAGGKYIYFLHLASLGSVVQISNQYQSQINSSFTYLADVAINGYLYRVLRQNFVTSEFENFLLTYYIQ